MRVSTGLFTGSPYLPVAPVRVPLFSLTAQMSLEEAHPEFSKEATFDGLTLYAQGLLNDRLTGRCGVAAHRLEIRYLW